MFIFDIKYIKIVFTFMIPIFLGNGNIIKRLLGQKLMVPLSKLWFGAYLIFPIVITLVYNTTDSALFLSITTILLGTLAIIVFWFLGGFGLYVFIQAPVANIVKLASDRITGCNINSLNHGK